jgi:hypothetical protein
MILSVFLDVVNSYSGIIFAIFAFVSCGGHVVGFFSLKKCRDANGLLRDRLEKVEQNQKNPSITMLQLERYCDHANQLTVHWRAELEAVVAQLAEAKKEIDVERERVARVLSKSMPET